MQAIVGILLLATGLIFVNSVILEHKPTKQVYTSLRYKSQTKNHISKRAIQTNTPRVKKALNLLIKRIKRNPRAINIILSAANKYGVPVDILETHWYQESRMNLGGNYGGASSYNALATITKRTNPNFSRRWKRFIANRRDLIAIAYHCNYNLSNLQGSRTGALGPFQFQPSTWIKVSIDGNGDNKACPTNLSDAVHGAALMLKNLANLFEKFQKHKFYNLPKKHRILPSLIKRGIVQNKWDFAMLKYAGVYCSRNYAYVLRSRSLRNSFCHVMQRTTGYNLPCSI